MGRYTGLCMLLVLLLCVYVQAESLRRKFISTIPLTGIASWYPGQSENDPKALTCAMRSTNFGTAYRVCNARTGDCVVVRHTSWGPDWTALRQGRIIDLSREAFGRIAPLSLGTVTVTITPEKGPDKK